MRRLVVTAAFAVTLAVPATAAPQLADEQSSCVAIITSFEASQLPAGAVGAEVSGLATSAPGFVGEFVSGLAKEHAGSIAACAGEG